MDFNKQNLLQRSIEIPKKIILIGKIIQFFSKSMATKFAAKLFVSPVKFPPTEREKMLYKSAQKTSLTISSIGKTIEVLQYGYSKKKVLFVHGWSGRSTQLFLTADKLLEHGYMYISFSGPAHCNSSGNSTSMPEFIEAIKEINLQFGPFDVAIGHSFGGMCLYNSIAEGFSVKKIITIGAPDKISEVIRRFTDSMELKEVISEKIKKTFDTKWRKNIDDHSSSTVSKNISIPALVIHDSRDNDVLVSSAFKIRQSLKQGKILITEGLGHTKILRNQKVTSRIIDFIKNEPIN